MNLFDILFYNIFSQYKTKYKQKANNIAITYVTLLQVSLLLLLGVFFAGFFKQMNMVTMSSTKAWTLFALMAVFLYFKNWMQYTGKKRMMINAKMNKKRSQNYSIWLLWFLPIAALGLTYVVYQAV
ncbi:hypothetical protein Q4Q39_12365 [Flavivirga amylovorans]|uniref:DUF4271 domain-containing protein n=1 Tax=Flavivirga amylovorans TaxID=870486 RepID=A0ABT8X2L4_9FLAO|nr:hypothetical protein [Flavivirga amylovorans]MDO5988200.1 hypothetical protein [Flavivirga amylovorans]